MLLGSGKTNLGDGQCNQIVVKGGKGTVALENNEVIHLLWKPKVRIEAADATAAMAAVNTNAQETEYPMLVDMTTTESVSRQARSVFTIRCAASRIALLWIGYSPTGPLACRTFPAQHASSIPGTAGPEMVARSGLNVLTPRVNPVSAPAADPSEGVSLALVPAAKLSL